LLTGLPGSGKTTTAALLKQRLDERGHHPVTLLDGEWFRGTADLPPVEGAGGPFRGSTLLRLARAAAELVRSGGITVCAAVAPHAADRRRAAEIIGECCQFFLVYLSTPLPVCERRDPKGLYARARFGAASLTGVTEPYEVPDDADLTLNGAQLPVEQAVDRILAWLSERGLIPP
jgi:sulfate adenylyltransferase